MRAWHPAGEADNFRAPGFQLRRELLQGFLDGVKLLVTVLEHKDRGARQAPSDAFLHLRLGEFIIADIEEVGPPATFSEIFRDRERGESLACAGQPADVDHGRSLQRLRDLPLIVLVHVELAPEATLEVALQPKISRSALAQGSEQVMLPVIDVAKRLDIAVGEEVGDEVGQFFQPAIEQVQIPQACLDSKIAIECLLCQDPFRVGFQVGKELRTADDETFRVCKHVLS